MRAVLDTNVLVSAILTLPGPAAKVVRLGFGGKFELIVSPSLLEELQRVLAYPKIRKRLSAESALAYVSWLAAFGTMTDDPQEPPPIHAPDPADDYLIALAVFASAHLVSGDKSLLSLSRRAPVLSVRQFLEMLEVDS